MMRGHALRYIDPNPVGSLVIYLMMFDGLPSIDSGIWVYSDGGAYLFASAGQITSLLFLGLGMAGADAHIGSTVREFCPQGKSGVPMITG